MMGPPSKQIQRMSRAGARSQRTEGSVRRTLHSLKLAFFKLGTGLILRAAEVFRKIIETSCNIRFFGGRAGWSGAECHKTAANSSQTACCAGSSRQLDDKQCHKHASNPSQSAWSAGPSRQLDKEYHNIRFQFLHHGQNELAGKNNENSYLILKIHT